MPITPKEYAFLEKFGLKIILSREDQGLSQCQLAEATAIDLETLVQIERGAIDLSLYNMHRPHTLGIESSTFFRDLSLAITKPMKTLE